MGDMTRISKHQLKLEARKHAVITGVAEVSSFHETEIVLRIDDGVMVVFGENLHIGKLLIEEGEVDVEGRIDGINYEKPKSLGRLFRFKKQG